MLYCAFLPYRTGAAIVAETEDVLSVHNRHFNNPLCFLQYYDSLSLPSKISQDEVCMYMHGTELHYIYIYTY